MGALLTAIPRVEESRNQSDYALAQCVHRAREMGASWAEIAQSMGITGNPPGSAFPARLEQLAAAGFATASSVSRAGSSVTWVRRVR